MPTKLNNLKMQPGGYSLYADRFAELACQLTSLPVTHLMYSVLAGLTAEFRQQVLVMGAKDRAEGKETCRRMDLA